MLISKGLKKRLVTEINIMYPLFSSCLFFLLSREFFFLAHLGLSVADPDLQISGGDGKRGSPDIREGTGLQKFMFLVLGPSHWFKNLIVQAVQGKMTTLSPEDPFENIEEILI